MAGIQIKKVLLLLSIILLIVSAIIIQLNMFIVDSTFRPVYNIFFYHVSSAWIAYVTFTVNLICSIMYLKTKNLKWDYYAQSSVIIGVVFAAVALVTGSLWFNSTSGNYQNVYWNWDPRQTMTLVLFFAYMSYLIFRNMIDNKDLKSKLSAVLGLVLFPTVPLSYLAAIIFASLHPVIEPTPSNIYWDPFKLFTLFFTVFTFTIFFISTLKTLVDLSKRKDELDKILHNQLEAT